MQHTSHAQITDFGVKHIREVIQQVLNRYHSSTEPLFLQEGTAVLHLDATSDWPAKRRLPEWIRSRQGG